MAFLHRGVDFAAEGHYYGVGSPSVGGQHGLTFRGDRFTSPEVGVSEVSVVPDLAVGPLSAAADHGGRPEDPKRAAGERVGAIGRAYGAGSDVFSRFVLLVLSGVVLIIVAGILLALLKANPGNGVVSEVHGWGRWLVGPFNGMFSFRRARVALAANWGIAAVIYLFAGVLISRLIGRSHSWRPLGGRPSTHEQEAS